jgi:hypothetical protein
MKYLSNFFFFLLVAAPIATGFNVAEDIRGSVAENENLLDIEEGSDLDLEDIDNRRHLGKGKGSPPPPPPGKGKGKGSPPPPGKGKGKGSPPPPPGKGKGKGTKPSVLYLSMINTR